jgi:hypothetical protein
MVRPRFDMRIILREMHIQRQYYGHVSTSRYYFQFLHNEVIYPTS